jgi:hypothetical protein
MITGGPPSVAILVIASETGAEGASVCSPVGGGSGEGELISLVAGGTWPVVALALTAVLIVSAAAMLGSIFGSILGSSVLAGASV